MSNKKKISHRINVNVNVSKILIALRLKVFGYQVLYVKKISIDSMGFSA